MWDECKYLLAHPDAELSARLADLAAACALPEPSVVVLPLRPPGPALELEPDRPLSPASMIKVPIAAALADAWERAALAPDDPVAIAAADMTHNDLPSPLQPGYRATTREIGELMLTHSDNVATNTLIELLGRDAITAYVRRLGLTRTAVRRKLSGSLPLIDDPQAQGRNAHPASDAARLLSAIACDAVSGAAWLRATLAAQRWNDKLSPGLFPDDRFLHKTGETDEVRHDGGILHDVDGRSWVVVVYTALDERHGDAPLEAFMRRLRILLHERA